MSTNYHGIALAIDDMNRKDYVEILKEIAWEADTNNCKRRHFAASANMLNQSFKQEGGDTKKRLQDKLAKRKDAQRNKDQSQSSSLFNTMSADLQQKYVDFLVEQSKRVLHTDRLDAMCAINNQASQVVQKQHKRMELRQKLEKLRTEKLWNTKIKMIELKK